MKIEEIEQKNNEISLEQFKEKVDIKNIGFAMSEEDWELSQDNSGIIKFAISKDLIKKMYFWCKKEGILYLVTLGMKISFGLARNNKILLNYNEEDVKEIKW